MVQNNTVRLFNSGLRVARMRGGVTVVVGIVLRLPEENVDNGK